MYALPLLDAGACFCWAEYTRMNESILSAARTELGNPTTPHPFTKLTCRPQLRTTVRRSTRLCDPLLCLNTIQSVPPHLQILDAILGITKLRAPGRGGDPARGEHHITTMFAGVGHPGKPYLSCYLDHNLQSFPLCGCSARLPLRRRGG